MRKERAILGGGCFWGLQELARKLPASGRPASATPVGMSRGRPIVATAPAKALDITLDPELLQIHDPPTPSRQGNGVGTSYRSAILSLSDEQEFVALETIGDVDRSGKWPGKVVTQVEPRSGKLSPNTKTTCNETRRLNLPLPTKGLDP